jgi:hypothetical protein
MRTIFIEIMKSYHVKIELGHYEIRNDQLYVKSRLYVLYHEKTRTRIIKKIHESLSEKHAERESTYIRISREYY